MHQHVGEGTKQNNLVEVSNLLRYQANVVHKNNTYYLEFHHGVPAHLVSLAIRYWIHSDQLGFIANASSVETGDDGAGCLRSSWETR